ncbi:MYND-type domain-containing protein [Pseudohyphozyma bogoriensis]|nr:MYND-type domain-containing protein [Pseudohyphozyma bogoriensis]
MVDTNEPIATISNSNESANEGQPATPTGTTAASHDAPAHEFATKLGFHIREGGKRTFRWRSGEGEPDRERLLDAYVEFIKENEDYRVEAFARHYLPEFFKSWTALMPLDEDFKTNMTCLLLEDGPPSLFRYFREHGDAAKILEEIVWKVAMVGEFCFELPNSILDDEMPKSAEGNPDLRKLLCARGLCLALISVVNAFDFSVGGEHDRLAGINLEGLRQVAKRINEMEYDRPIQGTALFSLVSDYSELYGIFTDDEETGGLPREACKGWTECGFYGCKEVDGLQVCDVCNMVKWCSEEHKALDSEKHANVCEGHKW